MKIVLTGCMKIATLMMIVLVISGFHNAAAAQANTVKSRIAVVCSDSKTKIWVSDFPKKTNIVVTDADNNLLSITSTNDFGTAFLSLPLTVKTNITVKTLDGETIATNTTVVKDGRPEGSIVAAEPNTNSTKA